MNQLRRPSKRKRKSATRARSKQEDSGQPPRQWVETPIGLFPRERKKRSRQPARHPDSKVRPRLKKAEEVEAREFETVLNKAIRERKQRKEFYIWMADSFFAAQQAGRLFAKPGKLRKQ